MDDGPDLSRLIVETRKLATENAEFCEIHAQQNAEIQKLKSTNENLQNTNDRLKKEIHALKDERQEKSSLDSKMENTERELRKKLREAIEENKIKSEELTQLAVSFHVPIFKQKLTNSLIS